MTSSSSCFVLVLIIVLLQFSSSTLASTKYIDIICGEQDSMEEKEYCVQMLTAYPPAVAATSLLPLGNIVYGLGISYAVKTARFAVEAEKHGHMPTLKTQFGLCAGNYWTIAGNLRMSLLDLKDDAGSASYDVMLCFDNTHEVKDLVEKNKDKASKKLMKMTLKMEKIIRIIDGTTDAVARTQDP